MNWLEIERDEFVDALRILELIPQRAGIPSSDYIRVKTVKGALEMALVSSVVGMVRCKTKGQFSKQGDFFIDRKLLAPFVLMGRKWKGNFEIADEEGKWHLRQGKRKAELHLRQEPVSGYGVWTEHSKLKEVKLSEELRKMLLASQVCSTSDPALAQFNCIYISGPRVLATNRNVVFMGESTSEGEIRIPFPIGVIGLLGEELVRAVGINGQTVVLDCGKGYIEGVVSEIALRDFPRKVLVEQVKKARTWPTLTALPAEKLVKVLGRLAEYLTNVRREDLLLRLELAEGKIRAVVKLQQGVFEETIEIKSGPKKEAVVEWPLSLVKPVLEFMAQNGETIKVQVDEAKRSPYLLVGGGTELLVGRRR